MFKITYLPIALNDLEEMKSYITNELLFPEAFTEFLDEFNEKIEILVEFPFAYKVYRPVKKVDKEIRVFPVKNFLVFYAVDGKVIEIQRVVFAKRDIGRFI